MSLAVIKATKGRTRPTISPEKGNELLGLLLLAFGVILAFSLVTYHPGDPSVFHKVARVADTQIRARNWVGPAGAHASAVAFSFLGLTCFLIPLFLLVAGWRRLRGGGAVKVVGRGIGSLLLLASTPALLQLTLGRIHWQDGSIAAGGAFGKLLVGFLDTYFSFVGSLLVLAAAAACGLALAVQSTLGDVLTSWRERLRQIWESYTLARERRRERREKERARRRVITKHLQRVVEEKQRKAEEEPHIPRMPAKRLMQLVQPPAPDKPAPAAPAPALLAPLDTDRLDLPLRPTGPRTARITERRGEAEFSGVRRVSASELHEDDEFHAMREAVRTAEPAAPAAPPRKKGEPQPALPFIAEIAPGTLPPVNLLQMTDGKSAMDEAELVRQGESIRSRCAEFGVDGSVEAISPGPVITMFEFQPAPGVKVSQIVNLQDDLALAMRAESVRIDRMPGRSTLGIEVPNNGPRGDPPAARSSADERFKKSPSVLTMALGTDINGEPYYADLATMPHLLVAGATGAGKSVGLQSMITSILYKATRDEVQFIFIDPKRIELGVYADIPHLKCEVVVDPKKAANALRWAVAEMERRYRLLAEVHVRSIAYYNRAIKDPQVQERLSLTDGESRVHRGGPEAAAVLRGGHRRAGRPDDGLPPRTSRPRSRAWRRWRGRWAST